MTRSEPFPPPPEPVEATSTVCGEARFLWPSRYGPILTARFMCNGFHGTAYGQCHSAAAQCLTMAEGCS